MLQSEIGRNSCMQDKSTQETALIEEIETLESVNFDEASRDRDEFRRIEADHERRENLNKEDSQRRRHRTWALIISVIVLLFMASLLMLSVYFGLFSSSSAQWSASVIVAIFVAPIALITVVTITFLIGVFRIYRDREFEGVTSRLSPLVRATTLEN